MRTQPRKRARRAWARALRPLAPPPPHGPPRAVRSHRTGRGDAGRAAGNRAGDAIVRLVLVRQRAVAFGDVEELAAREARLRHSPDAILVRCGRAVQGRISPRLRAVGSCCVLGGRVIAPLPEDRHASSMPHLAAAGGLAPGRRSSGGTCELMLAPRGPLDRPDARRILRGEQADRAGEAIWFAASCTEQSRRAARRSRGCRRSRWRRGRRVSPRPARGRILRRCRGSCRSGGPTS